MNDEIVLCSHELVIRFDQLEGNRVNWYLTPDTVSANGKCIRPHFLHGSLGSLTRIRADRPFPASWLSRKLLTASKCQAYATA